MKIAAQILKNNAMVLLTALKPASAQVVHQHMCKLVRHAVHHHVQHVVTGHPYRNPSPSWNLLIARQFTKIMFASVFLSTLAIYIAAMHMLHPAAQSFIVC